MFLSFLLALTVCSIFLLMYMLISWVGEDSKSKLTPFECGYEPLKATRQPFSLRYFILVVLFLVFDVETVLFLPLVNKTVILMNMALYTSLMMFLLLLMSGLLYEWYNDMLEWTTN
nr:NADH dehydrogenase subunit 3 [Candidula unifasciata unifasciata]